MRNHPCFTFVVAHVLSAALVLTPMSLSFADSISEAGREGQNFGEALNRTFEMPQVSNGTISTASGTSISINDLYPGTSSTNTKPAGTFFPGGASQTTEYFTDVAHSDSQMKQLGGSTLEALSADVNSEQMSVQGAAYSAVVDTANMALPDLRNDPVFNQTSRTLDDLDSMYEGLNSCSRESTIENGTRAVHVPDYKNCTRVTDKSGIYTLTHDYRVGVLSHHDGPANLQSCGTGCLEAWIGKVGDNYWNGSCAIFEEQTSYSVNVPNAITRVVLDYVKWDDYIQIYIGNNKVYNGPNDNFPPETAGACELSTSWVKNPNLDITREFTGVNPGDILEFKIRTSVSGAGEGYARLKIYYDTTKAIVDHGWASDEALDAAKAVRDGMASGAYQCTDEPPVTDGCATIDGVTVCESDFPNPSPLPEISNFCRIVDVDATYDFYQGTLECYTDVNGVERCPVNEGGNLDSCAQYEQNGQCGFMSTSCVEGSTLNGTCYVSEERWDCGHEELVPTTVSTTTYNCETGGSQFEDCQLDTLEAGTTFIHTPDYKTCERTPEMSACEITHAIQARREYAMKPVDFRVTTWDSSGSNEHCTVEMRNPDTNQVVTLDAHFDDDGNAENPLGLRELSTDNCLAVINHYIESNTSHYGGTGYASALAGVAIDIDTATGLDLPLDSCGGACTSWTGELVSVEQTVIDEEFWSPQSCLNQVGVYALGKAVGTISCTETFPTSEIDAGCIDVDGIKVCPDALQEPPISGGLVDKTCKTVSVNLSYDASSSAVACSVYDQDPSCGFTSSQCANDGVYDGGCLVHEETWDCGTDQAVVREISQTACPGPVRCMGNDCVDTTTTHSQDFAKAAALLNVAQGMASDNSCGDSTEENRECEVFKGEQGWCKIAVGGVQDCCEDPGTTSVVDYVRMVYNINKADTAMTALSQSKGTFSGLGSAYSKLAEPIKQNFSTVTKPFTSAVDNVKGYAAELTDPLIQEMKAQMRDWISNTFSEQAANSILGDQVVDEVTGEVTEEATGGAIQQVGSLANTLMAAYMYYQVAVMLIQIMYECEEIEFTTVSKVATKNCVYLGSYCASDSPLGCIEKRESYCCFNSPLSRIIQEQGRAQLGIPWGNVKNPDCSGLAVEDLNRINWDAIDLDEWVGLLNIAGITPNVNELGFERLTGEQSLIKLNEPNRDHVVERTMQNMENIDFYEKLKDAENGLRGGYE